MIRTRVGVGMYPGLAMGAAVALLLQASAPQASAQAAAPGCSTGGDLRQGRRSHPAEELSGVPSTRRRRPDVAQDLRGSAALGSSDQAEAWSTREMPPYRYDKIGIQHLKDDLRLSDADIQTIVRWVDGGAPLGNVADLPAPVQFPDGSKWAYEDRFGPPDLDRADQAVHASGPGAGPLVAADRARRHDRGPLHQGHGRQAVIEGPRRRRTTPTAT